MARFWADQFGSFAVRSGALEQVAPISPGVLEWSRSTDPFTIAGDVAWTDVVVSAVVDAPTPIPPASILRADGDAARLAPCNSSDLGQAWAWSVPAEGYVSNAPAPGAARACLNVYGCALPARVVLWECITGAPTCAAGNANLQWSIDGAGAVTSALAPGFCLTSGDASAAFPLTMAPCARGAANATWTRDAASGALELAGSGRCLAQPVPPAPTPPVAYIQVCGRLASYSAFDIPQPPPGYCLRVAAGGNWTLTSGAGPLATGALSPPPAPGAPLALALAFKGTRVTASADGAVVADVDDARHPRGMAALGSSYTLGGAPARVRSVRVDESA